jgi:hypothetical protein
VATPEALDFAVGLSTTKFFSCSNTVYYREKISVHAEQGSNNLQNLQNRVDDEHQSRADSTPECPRNVRALTKQLGLQSLTEHHLREIYVEWLRQLRDFSRI